MTQLPGVVPGILYLVSTPIGHLKDITLRALETLKDVDLIACEDTRVTSRLLQHYEIKKPLISYFEHNEQRRSEELIKQLLTGKNIALVSNAGTPLISDPGYELVQKCLTQSIRIVPLPGANALLAALSIAGFPSDRFVFEGFLPRKPGKRKKRLEALRKEPRTIIIYEAPYRLIKTLDELSNYLGDRPVALIRELTKIYEEAKRANLKQLLEELKNTRLRGEFTIVLEGYTENKHRINEESN